MKQIRFYQIITAVCCLLLISCGIDKNLKKGEKFLALGEYYDAADQFKQAYTKTPSKERASRGKIALKMARCYDKINSTPKADIAAHNFDKITSLCKEARKTALGFEIAHVGVNAGDAEESLAVCRALDAAFGFGVKEGNSSNFAGSGVEVMKSPYLGKNGHIAVKTNSIPRAAAELAKNGFTLDESTAKYKGEKMVAVYLKQEFGGFAVHLLQK